MFAKKQEQKITKQFTVFSKKYAIIHVHYKRWEWSRPVTDL